MFNWYLFIFFRLGAQSLEERPTGSHGTVMKQHWVMQGGIGSLPETTAGYLFYRNKFIF